MYKGQCTNCVLPSKAQIQQNTNNKMKNKQVLFIIASRDFRDEEYFIPRDILEENGFQITVASDRRGVAIGVHGNDVSIDLEGKDIDISKFVAVIFVGGAGAIKYLDNNIFYQVARDTLTKDIFLAAICIAPLILANAGILNGKKATIWSSAEEKKPIKILKEKGAIYKEEGVVCDGNIITASGPDQATLFAQKILEVLGK